MVFIEVHNHDFATYPEPSRWIRVDSIVTITATPNGARGVLEYEVGGQARKITTTETKQELVEAIRKVIEA